MRMIDADELIPLIKMGEMNTYDEYGQGRNGGIAFAIERIKQMPTIEPKKGKWEIVEDYQFRYECPVCRGHVDPNPEYIFCPFCGAYMKEDK